MKYLILSLALAINAAPLAATVHTGIDTLFHEHGIDFGDPGNRNAKLEDLDLELGQIRNVHGESAYPPVISAPAGLRDMGPVAFDSLNEIPKDLEPDPEAAGLPNWWRYQVQEAHLYVVWPQEGGIAKVFVRKLISYSEEHSHLITGVLIEWAYQDDDSKSFFPSTAVTDYSWGKLKQHMGLEILAH